MAVAIVMDSPGGTREQYDQVVGRMDLRGQVPPGGLAHAAGATGDGWRVVDVWESMDAFQRFADEKLRPYTQQLGLPEPTMRVVELHNFESHRTGDDARFVHVFRIDMSARTYDEVHEQIAHSAPDGMVWHAAGVSDGAWCILDSWTSREKRDAFVADRVMPAMQSRDDIGGPPHVEDLEVQATLRAGSGVKA